MNGTLILGIALWFVSVTLTVLFMQACHDGWDPDGENECFHTESDCESCRHGGSCAERDDEE